MIVSPLPPQPPPTGPEGLTESALEGATGAFGQLLGRLVLGAPATAGSPALALPLGAGAERAAGEVGTGAELVDAEGALAEGAAQADPALPDTEPVSSGAGAKPPVTEIAATPTVPPSSGSSVPGAGVDPVQDDSNPSRASDPASMPDPGSNRPLAVDGPATATIARAPGEHPAPRRPTASTARPPAPTPIGDGAAPATTPIGDGAAPAPAPTLSPPTRAADRGPNATPPLVPAGPAPAPARALPTAAGSTPASSAIPAPEPGLAEAVPARPPSPTPPSGPRRAPDPSPPETAALAPGPAADGSAPSTRPDAPKPAAPPAESSDGARPGGPTTSSPQPTPSTQPSSAVSAPASSSLAATTSEPGTPVRPASVPTLVGAEVQQVVARGDGRGRLVIRLDPPELGAVTIELAALGEELAIRARTDSVEAARALLRQRHEVQQAVEANGMSLGGFDVQADGDGQPAARSTAGRRRSEPETALPHLPEPEEPAGDHQREGAIFL